MDNGHSLNLEDKRECNHTIGFCQLLDRLISKDEAEETKEKYLSKECSYWAIDSIFNYCPDCGEKLSG